MHNGQMEPSKISFTGIMVPQVKQNIQSSGKQTETSFKARVPKNGHI